MLCRTIGNQIAALPTELPKTIEHATKRALIDWVAALLIGTDHPSAVALRAVAKEVGGQGVSAMVGTDQRTDPRTAALVNGTASHSMEVDDIYRDGMYHPGAPTIAAALAIGQARGLTGAEFLRAIAIGYEVSCRIAAAIQPAHYRFWHTTGTVGTLGAAIGASAAAGLDGEQTAHALAIATTMAAGLQQSFRSEAMSKPLHSGHGADAGVLAALSAAHGFTGALDVLEGPAGFGAAMSVDVEWSSVTAPWTEPWAVQEMTVKNHTCCGHTFAAVDAQLALRAKYDLKSSDVQSIVIETATIPVNTAGNLNPKTEFESKFSIPYCVAAALEFGSVRLTAFSDEAMANPDVRRLVANTELRATEEFDKVFPGQRAARVTLTKTNGEVLVEEAWTRRGDPEAPLTDDELSDKFMELATPAFGANTQKALDALWDVNHAPDVINLLSAI